MSLLSLVLNLLIFFASFSVPEKQQTVYSRVLVNCCRKSNRLQVRNLPTSATKDDVQQLVGAFGTVQRCDLGWCNIVGSFFAIKFIV